ncbi:unnamed protein product [Arctogadus glacialis]
MLSLSPDLLLQMGIRSRGFARNPLTNLWSGNPSWLSARGSRRTPDTAGVVLVIMATSLLRMGRLGSSLKCLRPESCRSPNRVSAVAALSTKSGGGKKPIKKVNQDKKPGKTYFDIEKLVQHKTFVEMPKKDPALMVAVAEAAAAAKPAAEPLAAAVTAEPAANIPVVEAPVAEAMTPVVEAAAPVVEAVEAAAPVVEAAAPVEAVAEAAAPVVEAVAPIIEEAPPVAAPHVVEAAPEAVMEAAPAVEVAPVIEAAPEPVAESAIEAPLAEAPIEASPAMEAETPVEESPEAVVAAALVEELVDPAPVLAEAAGEELQAPDEPEPVESPEAQLDPIQKLFVDSIRAYNASSQASGGLVDAGAEYQKALAEEMTKLQRLYGGGDLESFPEFKFHEPKLSEVSSK